ncbi:hypothetical protein X755_31450 [Mesorhizobium sp. LNJC405B00]|nr:hypothetical protein X755_31450 [Mesorhizobium sp. LNJC405B00]
MFLFGWKWYYRPVDQVDGTLKDRLGPRRAGGSGDDMADTVSAIAFPYDRRLGSNIKFDLGDTRYSSRPTVATDPIERAIAISN